MRADSSRQRFDAVVRPRVGVGPFRFGATVEDVTAVLGPPEQSWDDDGDFVLCYPTAGIALFAFDPEEAMRLVSFEIEPSSDAELWGLRIFQVPRDAVVRAAVAQGLRLQQERPDAPDDETLLQIRSEQLDFYYQGDRLVSLSAGVGFSPEDTIVWPPAP